jgi:hypothetical protein
MLALVLLVALIVPLVLLDSSLKPIAGRSRLLRSSCKYWLPQRVVAVHHHHWDPVKLGNVISLCHPR